MAIRLYISHLIYHSAIHTQKYKYFLFGNVRPNCHSAIFNKKGMNISEQPNGNSAVHKSLRCSHSNSNANGIWGIQNTQLGTLFSAVVKSYSCFEQVTHILNLDIIFFSAAPARFTWSLYTHQKDSNRIRYRMSRWEPITQQECIPVGCVPLAHWLTVSVLGGMWGMHAPCHAHPAAMHAPLPTHATPCHAHPPPATHAPHPRQLPHMPPCHACPPATHAPPPHTCRPPLWTEWQTDVKP